MKVSRTFLPGALVSSLLFTTALAHHSGAAVDTTQSVTINGTVKEFLWANPHCWLYVLVPQEQGDPQEWAIEGDPIIGIARTGLRSKSLQPGDKVEVTLAPRKDGKHGGGLRSVKLTETGQVFEMRAPPVSPSPL